MPRKVTIWLECCLENASSIAQSSSTQSDWLDRRIILTPSANKIKVGRSSGSAFKPQAHNMLFTSHVVSRAHAELFADIEYEQLSVKDLGSTHGTWVNGRRIVTNFPHILEDGDELVFGLSFPHISRGSQEARKLKVTYRWDEWRCYEHNNANSTSMSAPLASPLPRPCLLDINKDTQQVNTTKSALPLHPVAQILPVNGRLNEISDPEADSSPIVDREDIPIVLANEGVSTIVDEQEHTADHDEYSFSQQDSAVLTDSDVATPAPLDNQTQEVITTSAQSIEDSTELESESGPAPDDISARLAEVVEEQHAVAALDNDTDMSASISTTSGQKRKADDTDDEILEHIDQDPARREFRGSNSGVEEHDTVLLSSERRKRRYTIEAIQTGRAMEAGWQATIKPFLLGTLVGSVGVFGALLSLPDMQ